MNIAITGGTGFIGKQLAERHLKNGDCVNILSRRNLTLNNGAKLFVGDLSSPDVNLFDFIDHIDILYHCAGEINNESLMEEMHVNGTQRLVNAAKGKVGRFVQLSSVGAYGLCSSGVITEKSDDNPIGVYENTKTQSDNIIKNSGIPYVILRPSAVFSGTMTNRSLFEFLNMVRKGLFFYIGKKGAMVNYVHIEDVIEALINCGSNINAPGNIFIISQTTTVEKMVESFLNGLNLDRKVARLPKWIVRATSTFFRIIPGFPLTPSRIAALTGRCIYNSRKIEKELNFQFGKSLEENFRLFAKQK